MTFLCFASRQQSGPIKCTLTASLRQQERHLTVRTAAWQESAARPDCFELSLDQLSHLVGKFLSIEEVGVCIEALGDSVYHQALK
jgi:hypothetical protein